MPCYTTGCLTGQCHRSPGVSNQRKSNKPGTTQSDCTLVIVSTWPYRTWAYLLIATSQPNPLLLPLAKLHRTPCVLTKSLSRYGLHRHGCQNHKRNNVDRLGKTNKQKPLNIDSAISYNLFPERMTRTGWRTNPAQDLWEGHLSANSHGKASFLCPSAYTTAVRKNTNRQKPHTSTFDWAKGCFFYSLKMTLVFELYFQSQNIFSFYIMRNISCSCVSKVI